MEGNYILEVDPFSTEQFGALWMVLGSNVGMVENLAGKN